MASVRIAIVDDHPVARWGVEHVLESHPEVQIVCSAGSLEELREAGVDPHVVILDLYLQGDQPVLAGVRMLAAERHVLVMSASSRREDVLAAIRAGADGYLSKQASDDAFCTSVEQVAAGGFYLSSQLADMLQADLERRAGAAGTPGLAPREQETMAWIARGFTHAQAAKRMGVSQGTVDTYVKRIRLKLGLGNKADLTRKAIELARLDPDPPGRGSAPTSPEPAQSRLEARLRW
jgi:DNA-binding NarL/FixJ family response regulator